MTSFGSWRYGGIVHMTGCNECNGWVDGSSLEKKVQGGKEREILFER